MSVWTFSWWFPNKPPMTWNDRARTVPGTLWPGCMVPAGLLMVQERPGSREVLSSVCLLCCVVMRAEQDGWAFLRPGNRGQDSERGGARPLRRPGPGRATSVSHWSEPVPRPVQTQRCGLFVHRREACPRPCLQADHEHRALGSQGAFLGPLSLPEPLREAGWGASQSHCAFIWVSLVLSCSEDQCGS